MVTLHSRHRNLELLISLVTTSPKRSLSLIIFIFVAFILLLRFRAEDHLASQWNQQRPADAPLATSMSPDDLMSSMPSLTSQPGHMPRYIHQSWKDSNLDEKMSRWPLTCRALHPDWKWLLWTDEDNRNMVRKYFSWFLETYDSLPKEINRADAARNMYMFLFGGVYIDLDTECVQSMNSLFASRAVPIESDEGTGLSSTAYQGSAFAATAFFGRMDFDATDKTMLHTIPNAWMASTPGHPFLLLVLENLQAQILQSKSPLKELLTEEITGPVALYRDLQTYNSLVDKGIDIGELFKDNHSWNLLHRTSGSVRRAQPRIEMLPPTMIYPFAWNNAGKRYRNLCQSFRKSFDSRRCKDAVLTYQSYTISYWSHSWDM